MAMDMFMQLMISGMCICKIPEIAFYFVQTNIRLTKIIDFNYLVTLKALGLKPSQFLECDSSLSAFIYLFIVVGHLYYTDI